MVTPAAGTVVLVPFPFSDLSRSKLRPAIVLADVGHDDWVLCQVTSNPYSDPLAVTINDSGFSMGSLQKTSYARPTKLFTANHQIMISLVGRLTPEIFGTIVHRTIQIFNEALNEHVRAAAVGRE